MKSLTKEQRELPLEISDPAVYEAALIVQQNGESDEFEEEFWKLIETI